MALPLRVCYFGTYRSNYSRNRIMIEGLRRNGVIVEECHETLWFGIEDRVKIASGGWRNPSFLFRSLVAYLRLIRKYFLFKNHDIIVVGYPGQFDVFLAYLLGRLTNKPLVWDIFMSVYLIALERGLDKKSLLSIRLLRWLEKTACRLPDLLILDTAAYVFWFRATHRISSQKFRLVPTGADDRVFKPLEKEKLQPGRFQVLYYGTFIPNHGVEYIIEAAQLLSGNKKICFEFIGDGPEKTKSQQRVKDLRLTNIYFIDWLSPNELQHKISEADVCLGVFGNTPQSLMTVQNKIYECLAMAKPVITGESETVRKDFIHQKEIFLCSRADPTSLAEAIQQLCDNQELRAMLAENGYNKFKKYYSVGQIGSTFKSHMLDLISGD